MVDYRCCTAPVAVCSPKFAHFCSPLRIPALFPTHVITYYDDSLNSVELHAGGNSKTFSQKDGRLSNDSGLFEMLALRDTTLDDFSNKVSTYCFSHFDPISIPVSSAQKIKQGLEVDWAGRAAAMEDPGRSHGPRRSYLHRSDMQSWRTYYLTWTVIRFIFNFAQGEDEGRGDALKVMGKWRKEEGSC